MVYREVDSYTVIEVLRLANQRTRTARLVDHINGWFWRLLGL